jgi:hypothetical protein
MRRLLYLLLGLTVLTGAPGRAAEVDFGRYRALVIGINDYKHLPKLETPVNDASAVHDLLRRRYGYESKLLLNPDRTQLVEAFDRLRAELAEDDNLLIYYAGHGVLDRPTGEGFWLSVNAKPDSQVEWLPVSTVTRLLKASHAKHALVVADSCYSGVLVRDAPVALAGGAAREVELARLARKRARKALTSGGLEPVFDGGGDGHSVFTRAFLEVLRDNGEIIDGYQLFHMLRQRVVANAEQTPQYADVRMAGDEGGDFIFVPAGRASKPAAGAAPAPAAAAEPGTAAIELAFWQSIQASQYAGDFQAYLARYPNGAFAPLARNRLAALAAPGQAATGAGGRNAGTAPKLALTAPPQPAPAQSPVAVPPAPRAADGKWALKLRAVSFEEGEHGRIDESITVANGRFKSQLKDHFLAVDADLGFRAAAVEGTLVLSLGHPWRPFSVEIKGALDNAGFRHTYTAFARDFRGSNHLTLDVEVSLTRD